MELKKRLLFLGVGAAGGAAFMAVLQNITTDRACGSADLWTILSAIATAAAAAVALVVALDTSRQRQRDEQIRARLAAAQLAPMLTLQVQQIKRVCSALDEFIEVDPTPVKYKNLVEVIGAIVQSEPSAETIRSVAPLRDDCAERIASGFAQIKLAFQTLQQASLIYTERPVLYSVRRKRSTALAVLSKEVLKILEPAADECTAVSKLKIGSPNVA